MTAPLLLLLPGMLNDARVWEPVRDRLAAAGADAEVRVADLRQPASIAAMADAAWALLADVAPSRRLVVAGFSMGGYVALEMLAAPRRRVDALALVSTSARPETADGAVLRGKAIAAIERDFPKFVDGLVVFATDERFADDPDARPALRRMMLDAGAETAVRQNRAVMARADRRETAAALRLPCAVVCGADDRITPPPLSDELAALIPHARRHAPAACGHMAPLEQPQAVADALLDLLNPKET